MGDTTRLSKKYSTENSNILEQMKQNAVAIFNVGLKAVDPEACIHRICKLENNIFKVNNKSYDLSLFECIVVLGMGKAAATMAKALEDILKDRIAAGLVLVKYDHVEHLEFISLIEAGHPIPDANGIKGAKELIKMAGDADEKTLVINLISGGGSALMTLPAKGITLKDKQETTKIFLGCGATIHEINTIRKHLSCIKGGLLAKTVYPATLICLVLSDVVGDDLDIIACGPCMPDPGTFINCLEIIQTYNLKDLLPKAVIKHFEKGQASMIPETPKLGEVIFEKVSHTIIASNIKALHEAEKKAKSLGYNTMLLSSMIEGETRDAAAFHTAIAKEILATGYPLKPPACILSGGETTVTLKGDGKGGRNQEFALASAIKIQDQDHIVVLSAGTDGTDGPTDAAGAFADNTTFQRAYVLGLKPELFLQNNNAYPFFEQLSDLFKTGPTNTNVMDIRIMLIH